jgi:hypothetical protein
VVAVSQYPARTWDEFGRPACGRWMGWVNDDQPYLVGKRVELTEYGDSLVLARFSDGDRITFARGALFRFAALKRAS